MSAVALMPSIAPLSALASVLGPILGLPATDAGDARHGSDNEAVL